jgi:DNA polymerase-3 subunit delta'
MNLVGNVQLVAGDSEMIGRILTILGQEGLDVHGNPDLYIREYGSFGVDEAREIATKASSRAIASASRIFVIVTPGMTGEAQNALLKTLEEPSGGARFFIVVPSPLSLLPTLRSRAQILELERGSGRALVDAPAFLKAKPEIRLEMLKPLLEKNEDDKKDLSGIISFLSSLERELSNDKKPDLARLSSVYRARKYVADKGSLTKALLEQVALLI